MRTACSAVPLQLQPHKRALPPQTLGTKNVLTHFTTRPDKEADHCDECVCPSARISQEPQNRISVQVVCGCDSVAIRYAIPGL